MKVNLYNNCLNVVRLIAALQVMWGHAVSHLHITGMAIPSFVIYFFNGVPIFYAITGFLIYYSVERSPSFCKYIRKRFLRIYPELWVALIFEVGTLIFFAHDSINIKELSLFMFGQGTLFQFWTPDSLRTYGCGVPNGALWTIGIIIQFYLIVWWLYKLLKNNKLFFLCLILALAVGVLSPRLASFMPEICYKLYSVTVIPYLWLFLIGVMLAKFKDSIIPLIARFWWCFLVISFLSYVSGIDLSTGLYGLVSSSFLVVGLIGFAYRYPNMNIKTDISYGIYIYHMIVMNVFIELGLVSHWYYLIAVAAITLLLAYLSTITVGRWSLSKK